MCVLQTCNDKTNFYQPTIVLFSVLIFYFSLFYIFSQRKERKRKKKTADLVTYGMGLDLVVSVSNPSFSALRLKIITGF